MQASLRLFPVFCLSVLLTGCADLTPSTLETNVLPDMLEGGGSVHGGQQPIGTSAITVWAAGTSGYGSGATLLGSSTGTASGNFSITLTTPCPKASAPTYILASGGVPGGFLTNLNIMLGAALGPCSTALSKNISINEVTTAAMAYSMGQFFTSTLGQGSGTQSAADMFGGTAASGTNNQGLVYADQYTFPVLVNVATGQPNGTTTVGTTKTTVESAKIYSLANTLAACVNSNGETSTSETTTLCGQLFGYTRPGTGPRPYDTLQAAVQVARYPYQNVGSLYMLTTAYSPYVGLSAAPNDWTLGVSYTSTVYGLGIAGNTNYQTSSNIDIDETGNVWFPSNSTSTGGHGLGEFLPSTGAFGAAVATGLTHPQYLTITVLSDVWGSDFSNSQIISNGGTVVATSSVGSGGTGPLAEASTGSPDADELFTTGWSVANAGNNGNGTALSDYDPSQPPPLYADSGSDGSYYSEPTNALVALGYSGEYAATSGNSTSCALEAHGYVITVSARPCSAGGLAATSSGTDLLMTTSINSVCNEYTTSRSSSGSCFGAPIPTGKTTAAALNNPKGIAVDGASNIWIANSGNASVSTFGDNNTGSPASPNPSAANYVGTSPVAYLHNATYGGTMVTPYGIAIDRSGNVWVSNAGCVSTNGTACTPGSFVLSELVGAAAPTITPLSIQNTTVFASNGTTARPTTNAVTTGPQQATPRATRPSGVGSRRPGPRTLP